MADGIAESKRTTDEMKRQASRRDDTAVGIAEKKRTTDEIKRQASRRDETADHLKLRNFGNNRSKRKKIGQKWQSGQKWQKWEKWHNGLTEIVDELNSFCSGCCRLRARLEVKRGWARLGSAGPGLGWAALGWAAQVVAR